MADGAYCVEGVGMRQIFRGPRREIYTFVLWRKGEGCAFPAYLKGGCRSYALQCQKHGSVNGSVMEL